jgi:hypothetical protein
MKLMDRAIEDLLDAAISPPAPLHPEDACGMDFRPPVRISSDRPHLPLEALLVLVALLNGFAATVSKI